MGVDTHLSKSWQFSYREKRKKGLEEVYLLYSSLALLVMGCIAFILTLFFRSKHHVLNNLSQNLTANVFNKSFVVYDPYPEQRKIIHTLVFVLPAVAFFVSAVTAVAFVKLLEAGFLLSLITVIIGLNLMVVEGADEIYKNSKTFTKAVQDRANLGVGDVKVFNIIKYALPRMVKYYFGLSIFFIVLSLVLPHIWSSLLWFFAQSTSLLLDFSASTGVVSYQVVVLLFAVMLVVVQIFASKMQKKILNL